MNNEEKVKKIVDSVFKSGLNTNRSFYDMAYNSALEMARWKDEMLKNLLKERIDNCVLTDAYEGVQYETYVALFKDLFNEEL